MLETNLNFDSQANYNLLLIIEIISYFNNI